MSNPALTLPLAATPRQARSQASAAIADAAGRTGISFSYLLAQARIESALDPQAQASTSSASGLFQFIDQTWLDTMGRHGARLGYGGFARHIAMDGGSARVADPAMRDAILQLRFDPQASALMAGALAGDNRAALTPLLGREPDASELYLAHFLGQGDATRFLSALERNPDTSAVALLPRAARANRAIFHQPSGAPRTVAQVMGVVRTRVERAKGEAASAAQTHSVSPARGWYPPQGPAAPSWPLQAPAPLVQHEPRIASMALTLRDSFDLGSGDASPPGIAHVRRAYAKLGAFGL